jgi:dolichyl-phosphate-mannose--protein O-mannosyl transferase
MSKRALLASLALFVAGLALFLWRISYPRGSSFDELFYVPAARALLARTGNLNPQHPPLGKLLIALGLFLFGDNEGRLRIMSALFGAGTVAGMYWWGIEVFRRHETALWIALLALVNQLLYVQARTAMLDIFMVAFMVWGMAAFCGAWSADVPPQRARVLLILSGAMFGFANACKWLGLVPWATALLLVVVAKILQKTPAIRTIAREGLLCSAGRPRPASDAKHRSLVDADTGCFLDLDEPWLTPTLLRGVGAGTILLAFVVAPLAAYLSTFVPLMWVHGVDSSWHGLWAAQVRIWQERKYYGPWVQMSPWYAWPLSFHPLIYSFDKASANGEYGRYVIMIGNPVVLWPGVLAALFCLWRWITRGSRQAFLAILWYGALWLSWAVIPRTTTFYYYYLPAALALTIALGYCVEHLPQRRVLGMPWHWLYAALAAFFFALQIPVSSAMRVPTEWIPW